MKVRQCHAHPLFKRGVGYARAVRGRIACLAHAETELAKPWDHVTFPVLFGGDPRPLPCISFSRFGGLPCLVSLVVHEFSAKRAFGRVLIVRAAPQPHAIDGRLAAARDFVDVVELQERARRASLAGVADERALALVPLPDGALDVGGDVARARRRALLVPRLLGSRELAFLALADERVEGPVEQPRQIPRGDLVAEQGLRVAQLVVRVSSDADLEPEALAGNGR